MSNVESVEKWGQDKDAYFDNKRSTAYLPKMGYEVISEPIPQDVVTVRNAFKEEKQPPKEKSKAKPQETQKNKVSTPIDAQYEVVKPHPGRILVGCFGASLLHMGIQAALWYVFKMGSIDADGAIVGTIANCIAAGWRVCWRFKV